MLRLAPLLCETGTKPSSKRTGTPALAGETLRRLRDGIAVAVGDGVLVAVPVAVDEGVGEGVGVAVEVALGV